MWEVSRVSERVPEQKEESNLGLEVLPFRPETEGYGNTTDRVSSRRYVSTHNVWSTRLFSVRRISSTVFTFGVVE